MKRLLKIGAGTLLCAGTLPMCASVTAQVPAPAATPYACQIKATLKPLGPRQIGGVHTHGYQRTTTMQLPGMQVTQQGVIYFWDTPLPPQVLAVATGHKPCPPDSPVGRVYLPGHLMIYQSLGGGHASAGGSDKALVAAYQKQVGRPLTTTERATLAKMTASDNSRQVSNYNQNLKIQTVFMRGHVRTLTDADRALFQPPAGYRQVQ